MSRLTALALVAPALALAACGGGTTANPQAKQKRQVDQAAERRQAYIPHNNVEFNNYNEAQKLYDEPSTIIWCTTTWGNPSAPMVTVPVAGKLTSSSTTFFSPNGVVSDEVSGDGYGPVPVGIGTEKSVDGMYHPNPPGYRYGFTPGGQYVDLFNMPTFCTTALSKFQRQQTKVALTVDQGAQDATRRAEKILRDGTDDKGVIAAQARRDAQRVLEEANIGG